VHLETGGGDPGVAAEVEPADTGLLASLPANVSHVRNGDQGDDPLAQDGRVAPNLLGCSRDRRRRSRRLELDHERPVPRLHHEVRDEAMLGGRRLDLNFHFVGRDIEQGRQAPGDLFHHDAFGSRSHA
jgi:hypothetical protein